MTSCVGVLAELCKYHKSKKLSETKIRNDEVLPPEKVIERLKTHNRCIFNKIYVKKGKKWWFKRDGLNQVQEISERTIVSK